MYIHEALKIGSKIKRPHHTKYYKGKKGLFSKDDLMANDWEVKPAGERIEFIGAVTTTIEGKSTVIATSLDEFRKSAINGESPGLAWLKSLNKGVK